MEAYRADPHDLDQRQAIERLVDEGVLIEIDVNSLGEEGIKVSRGGGAIKTPYNWTTFGLEDGTYGIVRIHD